MHKIRIIHLIHQLGAGGAENGIINLANHIDRQRFEMAICAFVGKGSQTHRLGTDRIELFELNKRAGNDLKLPFLLFRLFRKWRPDIVHTHAWGTLCEGVLAAKVARIPIIIHGEHGTIQQTKRTRYIQKSVWRMTDRVLSVSKYHAQKLARTVGFPVQRITVLPNGVDSDRFQRGNRGRSFVRKADDILIGTVGRLVPVKNQMVLIDAFSKLCNQDFNIKLIIVGDGPLRHQLQTVAKDTGCADRIEFLGRRSDVPEIMRAMDIFVLSSYSEGMSNTILEAMSSGLPVVATAVGGNPELVLNGKTGLLVPTNDPEKLERALCLLIRHEEMRKEMGMRGRERVKKYFSLRGMIDNYEKLYLQCYREKAKGCLPTG